MAASGVRHGLAKAWGLGRHWSRKSGGADAYDAKGDAMAVIKLPSTAVFEREGRSQVWVLDKAAGKVRAQPVVVAGARRQVTVGVNEEAWSRVTS